MDELRKEQAKLADKATYAGAVDNVQDMIDLLTKTRDAMSADPSKAAFQLAKAKQPVKKSFDNANDNLKQVSAALRKYEKTLSQVKRSLAVYDCSSADRLPDLQGPL